ncbi:MAG: HlyC/CorC family transporter [Gammaproteobacteria bacterium]|nr:HlyC/CorC family transporter [Gammaproteobacteria bacterium]
MENIPLSMLFGILAGLILLSAFFSGSETALMSINRYRLRHKVRQGHRGAILVNKLLAQPDRLIGLILLGNNLANILASMITTIVTLRFYPGEGPLAIAAGILTLVILIFAEVAPKTLAALQPEILAYPAAYIYTPLLRIGYPLVYVVNLLANGVLKILGLNKNKSSGFSLSREELSTVVKEAGAMIPKRHRSMLLNVLQLEHATVEDIMVPRNEVVGIDLDDDWEDIVDELQRVKHTRIPVYRESIDHVIGILHIKHIIRLIADDKLNKELLTQAVTEPYFIPEGTPLTTQLLAFQRLKNRLALVVDEYGDLLGLVTLEDILEEIVGEFTTDVPTNVKEIHPQSDGSYLIDGGVHIRDINRVLHWSLPTDGPKTLNGMILEHMEMIPEPGTSLILHGQALEITKTYKNAVKMVKVIPDSLARVQKQSGLAGNPVNGG